MDKIRIIYNENFFRDEPAIIMLIIFVTILTIIITTFLVIKELRGKKNELDS